MKASVHMMPFLYAVCLGEREGFVRNGGLHRAFPLNMILVTEYAKPAKRRDKDG